MGSCLSCCCGRDKVTKADLRQYKYKPRRPLGPTVYRGGEDYSNGAPLPPHLWRGGHKQELSDIGEGEY